MKDEEQVEFRIQFHHLHIILMLIGTFCLALTRIIGLDIWWHLSVGRYLLQTFSFPHYDVFSFTAPYWDNKEWFFGIVVYLVERAGGFGLLSIAKAILFTATFLVIFVLSYRRSRNSYISIAVVIVAALVCRIRLAFRPELFSYLFISILLLMLDSYMRGKRRPLCFFPLLMLLWINLHPLAFIGLIILFIYIIGEIICRILKNQARRNSWRRLGNREFLLLLIIFTASCLAFACNPIALKRFLSPIELLTRHSAYIANIIEIKPLPILQFPAFAVFVLLAIFTLVMFLTVMEPADTIMVIFFGITSLTMARNAPLLPVCAAAIIACRFSRFFSDVSLKISLSLKRWRTFLNVIFSILLIGVIIWAFYMPFFGIGFTGWPFPLGAVSYIKANSPEKEMFNIYDWGGFLIWGLYPEYKVFIDGRGPDAYPPHIWADYQKVQMGEEGWEEILDEYGVNFILISTGNKLHNLIWQLNKAKDWRLNYWDFQSMLFLRDVDKNRRLIESYEYKALDTKEMRFRYLTPQLELQVMSELYRYLKEDPESLRARNLLTVIYMRRGLIEKAIEEYETLASSHPSLSMVHFNLGVLYSQKGDQERAMVQYEKELLINKKFPPAYNNLGRILYDKGEIEKAAKCFKKALKYEPKFVHAINNLGIIYMEERQYGKAIDEFEKALEIDPSSNEARQNLNIAKTMLEKEEGLQGP